VKTTLVSNARGPFGQNESLLTQGPAQEAPEPNSRLHCECIMQETLDRRLQRGDFRQETSDRGLQTGGFRQEASDRRLQRGGFRQDASDRRLQR
jgi:hypothetical protein